MNFFYNLGAWVCIVCSDLTVPIFRNVMIIDNFWVFFSSPEPKAEGELLPSANICRES